NRLPAASAISITPPPLLACSSTPSATSAITATAALLSRNPQYPSSCVRAREHRDGGREKHQRGDVERQQHRARRRHSTGAEARCQNDEEQRAQRVTRPPAHGVPLPRQPVPFRFALRHACLASIDADDSGSASVHGCGAGSPAFLQNAAKRGSPL